MNQPTNLETALAFLKALENRTSFEDMKQFYHPDIEQVEYPNAITKNTAVRNLNDLKAASVRGQSVLQKETYEVVKAHEAGNCVIIEAIWRGTLAIPLGNIPVGGEMKAYFGQFYEFKDGKIFRQSNYDCFESFN